MTESSTFISLGSSLTQEEAQKIYPEGRYHRPFEAGDIIRLLRLFPKRIAIIDGVFEHTASVWHKEILWALSEGVEVYGASSMGALRAAEMHTLGMKPIGLIAERYQKELTMDDAEVALTDDIKGRSTTLTLINLDYTLQNLQANALLSPERAKEIRKEAQKIPYFKRQLQTLKLLPKEQYLLTQHFINQKQIDARLLLCTLKEKEPQNISTETRPAMVDSVYFRQLYHHAHHTPFQEAYTWLPAHEAWYAKLSPPHQTLITHYGKLLHLTANRLKIRSESATPPALKTLVEESPETSDFSIIRHHLDIFYQLTFPNAVLPATLLDRLAVLFDHILRYLLDQECLLTLDTLQAFSKNWRREFDLQSMKATEIWQRKSGLIRQSSYARFMYHMACWDCFVLKNNAEAILFRGPLWRKNWVFEIKEEWETILPQPQERRPESLFY